MEKHRIDAINIVLGVIWLGFAAMNASTILLENTSALYPCLLCVIDMLFSRGDIANAVKDGSGLRLPVIDKRMDRYGMLSAIGAGIYMSLAVLDLSKGRVYILRVAALLFLLFEAYYLSVKSRRRQ